MKRLFSSLNEQTQGVIAQEISHFFNGELKRNVLVADLLMVLKSCEVEVRILEDNDFFLVRNEQLFNAARLIMAKA